MSVESPEETRIDQTADTGRRTLITDELTVLLEEYKQLSAQAVARYAHRYHFHYLVLIVVGALTSIYVGATDKAAATTFLLIGPTVFAPVILLMIKQHAYIDLRYLYIERCIRPRISQLLLPSATSLPQILGWNAFEQKMLRGAGPIFSWSRFFAVVDYILPVLMCVYCLGGFVFLRNTPWPRWEVALFILDLALMVGAIAALLVSRLSVPHLRLGAGRRSESP